MSGRKSTYSSDCVKLRSDGNLWSLCNKCTLCQRVLANREETYEKYGSDPEVMRSVRAESFGKMRKKKRLNEQPAHCQINRHT